MAGNKKSENVSTDFYAEICRKLSKLSPETYALVWQVFVIKILMEISLLMLIEVNKTYNFCHFFLEKIKQILVLTFALVWKVFLVKMSDQIFFK